MISQLISRNIITSNAVKEKKTVVIENEAKCSAEALN